MALSSSSSSLNLRSLQCWEKATNYLDVEERFVHLTDKDFVATPEGVAKLVDENTIGKNLA